MRILVGPSSCVGFSIPLYHCPCRSKLVRAPSSARQVKESAWLDTSACHLQLHRLQWTLSWCLQPQSKPLSGSPGFVRQRRVAGQIQAGLDFDFEYAFENGLPGLLPALPPEPVQFPRKPLDLKFAVLLMRSSYEACDDLDFIAMDKFQAKFWKLRQAEVEPYTLQYAPLKIRAGELTDPLYFDFISFAQYATISSAMRSGEVVFQEKLGAFGDLKTVRRDERLRDNSLLPAAFKQAVGDKVYRALLEGFEEEDFGAPAPCAPEASLDCMVAGVRQMLKVFVERGYALSASLTDIQQDGQGTARFKVKVDGPATLWGVRELASRRTSALTDFDAMAIGGFLRASHRTPLYKSRYTDTSIEHIWTVPQVLE